MYTKSVVRRRTLSSCVDRMKEAKKLFMSHKRWSTTQLTRHRILQTLSIYILYGVRWFSENYTNCVERWRTTHTHKRIETVPRHQAHGQKHTAVFCSSQCFDEICFIARLHLLHAFIHICQRFCFFSCAHFFWLLLLLFDVENVRLRSICLRHQSNHREYIEASIYIFVWRKVCFKRGHCTHFIHKYHRFHRFFPSNWSPTCAYSS